MDLSYLYNQISDAQLQIAELRNELAGLESFEAEVINDAHGFDNQLQSKRNSLTKATGISNMKAAEGYKEKMDSTLSLAFQENVFECFNGVNSQIAGAIQDIEDEIKELQKKIASLEDQIEYERQQEAKRERDRQRRAREAQAK